MAGYQKNKDGKVVIQIDTSAKVDLSAYEKIKNAIAMPPQQLILPELRSNLLLPSDISLMPLPKRNIQHLQPNIVIHNCYEEQEYPFHFIEGLPSQDRINILEKMQLYGYKQLSLLKSEHKILLCIKKDPTISNTEIANKLHYSLSFVEKTCSNIRKKFAMDNIKDSFKKRYLLVELAKELPL